MTTTDITYTASIDGEQFPLANEQEWLDLRVSVLDAINRGGGWITIPRTHVSVDVLINSSTRARLTRTHSVAERPTGDYDPISDTFTN
ncbi:hypothetical protein [Diaminobutyricimonas sp. TR449]|uniref:hypothetical protein n=1 Tax=Diaminobutyricimonas sp. TR449 TaxID=2708076 RepID=UPI0014238C9A|nr:hypothetical protein [Diaminobutyricimonas sp. TR449]